MAIFAPLQSGRLHGIAQISLASVRRVRAQLRAAVMCFQPEWNPYIALMIRRGPRKIAVWLGVFVVGLVASLCVLGYFTSTVSNAGFQRWAGPNEAGRMLIFGLAYAHFVFGPLLMLGLSSLAFKSEYQRRTLEGVLVAPMTPLELIAKKSAQIWLPLLMISAMMLPLYSLGVLAGGVSPMEALRWWLLMTAIVSLQIPPAVFAFPLRRATHLNRWMGWRILLFEIVFVFIPMFGGLFAGAAKNRPPFWILGLVNFMFTGGGPFGLVDRIWHGLWQPYPFYSFSLPPFVALLLAWLPMNITKAYHSAFVIALLPSLNLGPTPTRPKRHQLDEMETPHQAAALQKQLMKYAKLVQFFTTLLMFGYLWPPLVAKGVMAGVLVPGSRDVGGAMAALLFVLIGMSLTLNPMVVALPQSQMNLMFLGESEPLARRVLNAFRRLLIGVPLLMTVLCLLGWRSPLLIPPLWLAKILVVTLSVFGLRAAVDAFVEVVGTRYPWIVRGPGDVIYILLMLAPFALLLCPIDAIRNLCVASPLFAFASLLPWTNDWISAFPRNLLHPIPAWHVAPLVQLPLAAVGGGIAWHVHRLRAKPPAPIENPRRENLGLWLVARVQRWWDNPVSTIALRRQARRGVWDTPVLTTVPLLLWMLAVAMGFPHLVAWLADRMIPGLLGDCATEPAKALRFAIAFAWVVLSLEGFAAAWVGYNVGSSEDAKRSSANFAMLSITPLSTRSVLTGNLVTALMAALPVAVSCVPFLIGIPLVARDSPGLALAAASIVWWFGFLLFEVMFVLLFPMFGNVGQVVLGTLLIFAATAQLAYVVDAATPNPPVSDKSVRLAGEGLIWLAGSLLLFGVCWWRLHKLRTSDLSLGAAVEN